MTARLARLPFTRLAHTGFWLVLIAGMGGGGAPVETRRHPEHRVPPAAVRELTVDGDEAPAAPTRPLWALSSSSVRVGSRGLGAGSRSRFTGGAVLAGDPQMQAPVRAALARFVRENELPENEREWGPHGIRGPPA